MTNQPEKHYAIRIEDCDDVQIGSIRSEGSSAVSAERTTNLKIGEIRYPRGQEALFAKACRGVFVDNLKDIDPKLIQEVEEALEERDESKFKGAIFKILKYLPPERIEAFWNLYDRFS